MQVSQVLESDNIAVIGGGKARAFEIGQSAHAFKILSDALYSDKILATVREVISNAEDSHRRSGVKRSIDVTLTDAEFAVRDYGAGIPDDKIIPIFCTYFGSDKTDKDGEIGGFGLGAKAPFAYSDGFTMISRHKGQQRVYALYIADEETGGAPACKLMATANTTEQGVTITIPLKEAGDRFTFEEQIRSFVFQGGLNVNFNDKKLNTRNYKGFAEAGIGLFDAETHSRSDGLKVYYGGVVYPLTANSEINVLRDRLAKFRLDYNDLVLYAPPSSITVTPSRESISYSPKTIAALNGIMERCLTQMTVMQPRLMREEFDRLIKSHTRETVALAWFDRNKAFKEDGDDAIGCEAISRRYVRSEITTSNALMESFRKHLMRHVRDHRKQFRVDLNSLDSVARIQHRYFSRKLLKLAAKVELDRRIYLKDGEFLRSINKPTGRVPLVGRLGKPVLLLTNTREAALAPESWKSVANNLHWKLRNLSAQRLARAYVLVKDKISDEELQFVADFAEKNGFQFAALSIIPTPKVAKMPKPKIEKPKDKYIPFSFDKNHRRRGKDAPYVETKLASVEHPSAYVAVSVAKATEYNVAGIPDNRKGGMVQMATWLKNNMPNVVLATNKTERDRLVKAGVPALDDLLLKRIRSAIESSPLDLAILMTIATPRPFTYEGPGKLANALIELGTREAYLAFGILRDSDKADHEAVDLLRAAMAFYSTTLRNRSWQSNGTCWPDSSEEKRADAVAKEILEISTNLKNQIPENANRITKSMLKGLKCGSDTWAHGADHLKFFATFADTGDLRRSRGRKDKHISRFLGMIEDELHKVLGPEAPVINETADINLTPTEEGILP